MDEQRTIIAERIRFVGHHGVFTEEKRDGVPFQLDLKARVGALPGFSSDALAETVDYRDLIRAAMTIALGSSVNLIEHLAERIADHLLASFPLEDVEVTIRKKAALQPFEPEWVGVVVYKRGPPPPDDGAARELEERSGASRSPKLDQKRA